MDLKPGEAGRMWNGRVEGGCIEERGRRVRTERRIIRSTAAWCACRAEEVGGSVRVGREDAWGGG